MATRKTAKKKTAKKAARKTAKSSTDEQIGYHKGALTTLMKERQELVRIVSIVEQLIQMHMNGLQELGVDLRQEGLAKKPKAAQKRAKVPIDQII